MRILHLIHSEGVYGAESVLLCLAREQRQRGHEPLIGSIRDPGTAETRFEALTRSHGLTVAPIRIAPRPTPGVVRALLGTLDSVRPDVVHSHGYKANILLGPVPRRRRGPMLATLHGWTNARRFSRMRLYEYLDSLALRRLDAVVVVARYMLSLRALRGVAKSRLWVIENGIPPLTARLDELATRGAAPLPAALVEFTTRRPTLVAIGRLSPEKGFMRLVDAFARVCTHAAASHQLLIVGEGPQRDLLMSRITTLGLTDVVCLPGYIEAADRLLEHAVGFVMSSSTEGAPLALLEAMQWRVPILATSVGGVSELLDEGRRGRLAPPDDLAALTQGLKSLMAPDPGTVEQTINAANAAVLHRYTSARMADEYLSAYTRIA